MNKKYFMNIAKPAFLMSMLLLTSRSSGEAPAQTFSSTFSGTINANLPTTKYGNQPKKMYFPPAGNFMFSSSMYCGDGDVATFSRQYPNMKFYPTTAKTSAMVIGYWAAPKSSSTLYPAPTMATWFTLGYASPTKMNGVTTTVSLPIDGAKPITTLHEPNTGLEKPSFSLVSQQLKTLTENATHGMVDVIQVPGFAPETYRLYVAAMACPTFTNVQGAYKTNSTTPTAENNGALATTITKQILTGSNLVDTPSLTSLDRYIESLVYDASTKAGPKGLAAVVSNLQRFDVVASQATNTPGVRLKFSPSGAAVVPANLTSLISTHIDKVVKGAPGSEDAVFATLKASVEELNNHATCTLGSKTTASLPLAVAGERFNYEAFPTYGACQFGLEMARKSDLANMALPDPQDSDAQKIYASAVIKAFIGPAIMRMAQQELDKKTKFNAADINSIPAIALNKVSCLPGVINSNFDYITTIPNSIYLPIKSSSGKLVDMVDPGQTQHPEGGFAVGQYQPYVNSGGDTLAVFNNFYDLSKETDFQVTCGTGDPVTLTTRGANFKFKIRSIGCSQNVYCRSSEP